MPRFVPDVSDHSSASILDVVAVCRSILGLHRLDGGLLNLGEGSNACLAGSYGETMELHGLCGLYKAAFL